MPTPSRSELSLPAALRGASPSVRALERPQGPPLVRDLRWLGRLAHAVYLYWTAGARVRRAYREAEATGATLWLDEAPQPQTGKTSEGR